MYFLFSTFLRNTTEPALINFFSYSDNFNGTNSNKVFLSGTALKPNLAGGSLTLINSLGNFVI
jgi:hypothetical protein